MVEVKTKLVLKITGDSLSECEDAVTQWAGARIKARIMAQPQAAVTAQMPDLPQGLKINPIRMTPEMRESIDKAEVKRKQKFEEV